MNASSHAFACERWGFALYRNGKPERRVLNLSHDRACSEFEELALRERDARDSNVQLLVRQRGRGRYEAIVQTVGRRVFVWDGARVEASLLNTWLRMGFSS